MDRETKETRGRCDDMDVAQLDADVSIGSYIHSQGAATIGVRAKDKIIIGTPRVLLRSSLSSSDDVVALGN